MRSSLLPSGKIRSRQGFAMLLLAVAAAAVCTVTVSTQNNNSVYEIQTVRQIQRSEQTRWIAEAFSEVELAEKCNPPAPPLFPMTYVRPIFQLGYTAGPEADSTSPVTVRVQRTGLIESVIASLLGLIQTVEVSVFADASMAGKPLVQREQRTSGILLESLFGTGPTGAKISGVFQQTGWTARD